MTTTSIQHQPELPKVRLPILIIGTGGIVKDAHLPAYRMAGLSLAKGLLLSLLAGVLSAVYGFALNAGDPIADVASAHGAGVFRGNVVYIISITGAFITTAIYSLWLHWKNKTLGEIAELRADAEKASLPVNWAMAVLTDCLWYGQFLFYNLGHVRMGDYKFTSWAIHMIMLILFSIVVGVVFNEWRGSRSPTKIAVGVAFIVLVGSVLALTYGNHLAEIVPAH